MDVDAPPVEELSCRVISLVEPLFPFSIQSKFKKTCFKLRFRGNGKSFERFPGLENLPLEGFS